jgi:hypothetical protein
MQLCSSDAAKYVQDSRGPYMTLVVDCDSIIVDFYADYFRRFSEVGSFPFRFDILFHH